MISVDRLIMSIPPPLLLQNQLNGTNIKGFANVASVTQPKKVFDKSNLLSEIHQGIKLKKTTHINDRSSPIIANKAKNDNFVSKKPLTVDQPPKQHNQVRGKNSQTTHHLDDIKSHIASRLRASSTDNLNSNSQNETINSSNHTSNCGNLAPLNQNNNKLSLNGIIINHQTLQSKFATMGRLHNPHSANNSKNSAQHFSNQQGNKMPPMNCPPPPLPSRPPTLQRLQSKPFPVKRHFDSPQQSTTHGSCNGSANSINDMRNFSKHTSSQALVTNNHSLHVTESENPPPLVDRSCKPHAQSKVFPPPRRISTNFTETSDISLNPQHHSHVNGNEIEDIDTFESRFFPNRPTQFPKPNSLNPINKTYPSLVVRTKTKKSMNPE